MITQERLKELFNYNNRTGKLIRKVRLGNQLAGTVVGNYCHGYLQTSISNKSYYIHRLVYLYKAGWLPKFIDHIDGNKLNNKINNLRECTSSQNKMNKGLSITNKSGVKGVHWSKKGRNWCAQITTNYKTKTVGHFKTIDEASIAVRKERALMHKEFSNNGFTA